MSKKKRFPPEQKKRGHDLWAGPPTRLVCQIAWKVTIAGYLNTHLYGLTLSVMKTISTYVHICNYVAN